MNFNTSHVEVYRLVLKEVALAERYFNTSHVEVYPIRTPSLIVSVPHFNTSHVEVYPEGGFEGRPTKGFQYISC